MASRTPVQPALTIKQIAEKWGCAYTVVRALILRGDLKAFSITKPGSVNQRWRILPEEVERYEQRQIN